MSILLEITTFCFSSMKNEIRDRLMMKYLSCRLGIFIFKYGLHPLPVKSQHVTIRVVVSMQPGWVEPSPIFIFLTEEESEAQKDKVTWRNSQI